MRRAGKKNLDSLKIRWQFGAWPKLWLAYQDGCHWLASQWCSGCKLQRGCGSLCCSHTVSLSSCKSLIWCDTCCCPLHILRTYPLLRKIPELHHNRSTVGRDKQGKAYRPFRCDKQTLGNPWDCDMQTKGRQTGKILVYLKFEIGILAIALSK